MEIVEPRSFAGIPRTRARNSTALAEQLSAISPREDDVYVYQRWWPDPPLARPGVHIWRTMFETSGLPDSWVDSSHAYDSVWVPTLFNRDTFCRAGVPIEKLTVIPSPAPTWSEQLLALAEARGSDPEAYSEQRPFLFLSVGKWESRKGWELLIDAFIAEFGGDDHTELLIKTNPFNGAAPSAALAAANKGIRLEQDLLQREEMLRLYAQADAFVIPSRGEGWGRPYMEAILAGLPSIVTNWGGALRFAQPNRCLLVSCSLVACSANAITDWPYYAGQEWAEADHTDLRRALRIARSGWRPRVGVAAVARELSEEFSATAIARLIVDALEHRLAPLTG
ncbi:MAG TPA: glycosyltransferase family 4 protein [Solirubrobacteraceae bacterium]|nr:glycosyltransferase family 4 protein [Solirubrobacteraceae bacterium]